MPIAIEAAAGAAGWRSGPSSARTAAARSLRPRTACRWRSGTRRPDRRSRSGQSWRAPAVRRGAERRAGAAGRVQQHAPAGACRAPWPPAVPCGDGPRPKPARPDRSATSDPAPVSGFSSARRLPARPAAALAIPSHAADARQRPGCDLLPLAASMTNTRPWAGAVMYSRPPWPAMSRSRVARRVLAEHGCVLLVARVVPAILAGLDVHSPQQRPMRFGPERVLGIARCIFGRRTDDVRAAGRRCTRPSPGPASTTGCAASSAPRHPATCGSVRLRPPRRPTAPGCRCPANRRPGTRP